MSKTSLGLCAGAWLLLLAGCASSEVAGMLFAQGSGDDRVVVGSLDEVAKSTQGTLQRLHLRADITKQGEALHIDSATPEGTRFRLVLTKEKAGAGEQTHLRLEWLDRGAEHLSVDILSRLEKAR